MQILLQNSAQALGVIWSTAWHTFWLVVFSVFIAALGKKIVNSQNPSPLFSFQSPLLNELFAVAKQKLLFFIGFSFVWWYFFGFLPLVLFIIVGVIFLFLEAGFFALQKRKIPELKSNLKTILPTQKEIGRRLKKMTQIKFWQDQASLQLRLWRKITRAYIFSLLLIFILGGFLSYSFWTEIVSSPVLQFPNFLLNFTLGAGLGIVLPVSFFAKLPFSAILWRAGLPFGALSAYFLGSYLYSFLAALYKKSDLKITFIFAVYSILALFLAVFIGQGIFSMLPLQNFQGAQFLQKEITMNYVFWCNLISFIILITALVLRDWKVIFKQN